MYILKSKNRSNVVIYDIGVAVLWNDPNGTPVDEWTFEHSEDARRVRNKLIVESDGLNKAADKNVVETENELMAIKKPYDTMSVFIKDYNNTGNPCHAIYVHNKWKFISGGSGSDYIHPLTHLATMIEEDINHRFVTDNQISIWDNKSDFSGSYNDLIDKPQIFSGDYVDLINKPAIFSGNYNDLTNKPVLFSGDFNDLENAPLIFSGSYNDLIEKPIIPEKTSDLTKDDVYTKLEVDSKIALIPGGGTGGTNLLRYEAEGSLNGDCWVLATGNGVQFNKTGNTCSITCPDGVQVLSLQIRFSGIDIGATGNCLVDFGSGIGNGTGINTDYNNIYIPQFQVINDVEGSRAYKVLPSPAANLNMNAHTMQITGLTSNIGVWVRLTF